MATNAVHLLMNNNNWNNQFNQLYTEWKGNSNSDWFWDGTYNPAKPWWGPNPWTTSPDNTSIPNKDLDEFQKFIKYPPELYEYLNSPQYQALVKLFKEASSKEKEIDFKKAFEIYIQSNPVKSLEELFIAAMKIGFVLAKMADEQNEKSG